MTVLGISCFYHDSAAALIIDGKIIAAAQEERFSRKKHDQRFPHEAIKSCLAQADITMNQVDLVAFYDKPFLKFERLLETYLAFAPRGFKSYMSGIPVWIKQKLWITNIIEKELNYTGEIIYTEHHQSHAASAFFPSPFKRAAFLTVDGVGEWATTSFGVGNDNNIEIKKELHFPHSLGLLYSAMTYYLGFRVNSGEYKVMGLAPYGEPKYADKIREHLIDIKDDGSFWLNMKYFKYPYGLSMTTNAFHELFGGLPRKPESKLTQREMDLAKSLQVVTEEILLNIANHVYDVTGEENLCLAGGVALNCVANGRIIREGKFKYVWIQPASGDAGGALGAALFGYYQFKDNEREVIKPDAQYGSYLGPSFSDNEIQEYLDKNEYPYEKVDSEEELTKKTADLLANENVVGWFQGRMEYGPRALGSRSIIGDPRSKEMQTIMNVKIKFRESFRPFAPSVLEEYASEYFNLHHTSPYMLVTTQVVKEQLRNIGNTGKVGLERLKEIRSTVPAITHVDNSARVQTVSKQTNPRYHALLSAFRELTGCPLVVNTSFNVRGEPIVCTPEDAYRCFMRTNMDYLVLGSFILDKKNQPEPPDDDSWKKEYGLD